jgi:hypothetical protein
MKSLLLFPVLLTALSAPMNVLVARGSELQRTVHFSALDSKGAPVTDLTAGDLAVKEGGKERAIAGLQLASEPMLVSLLVDDAGTGAFQAAVAQFIQTMLGHAQFAMRAFNPQPSKLQTAITGIGPRGNIVTVGQQMVDAVADAAKELQQRKAARAVIVVLTVGGEKAQSQQAEPTLNAVKNSGACLNVVYLAGLELGQVLGDGPKRSGGMIEQIGGGVVPGPVLAKVAESLLHQYELTYTLPDGVKANEKFSLSTSRKGVTLLAPSRVPDK